MSPMGFGVDVVTVGLGSGHDDGRSGPAVRFPAAPSSRLRAGVIARWVSGWGDALDDVARDLQWNVAGLDGQMDPQVEGTRRWMVLDWMVRAVAPRWLGAVGLGGHAGALRSLAPIGTPTALARAGSAAEQASGAARARHEAGWYAVEAQARPDAHDRHRSQVWLAMLDGTQTAARAAETVVEAAARATGCSHEPERGPVAWRGAVEAITHSAAAICWEANLNTISQPGWTWQIPPEAARALAYTSARTALGPVEMAVQGAVCELFTAIVTVTPPGPAIGVRTTPDAHGE